ncbi:MAG: hypothetical protein PHE51_11375 [Eubacteriales bacterium]|nr:hypothetical protein [Eubacteriales bacterium]
MGKAICEVRSIESRLQLRFSFLPTAIKEFLLRKNIFSSEFTNIVLKQSICVVDVACRCYGGSKTACSWRQYFWVRNRLIMACPYPWVYFKDLNADNLKDIKLLLDLQMHHMTQDQKDIKGETYTDVNIQRCGEVKIIHIGIQSLDIDTFVLSDHVDKPVRLDKYVNLYNLISMGEKMDFGFIKAIVPHAE